MGYRTEFVKRGSRRAVLAAGAMLSLAVLLPFGTAAAWTGGSYTKIPLVSDVPGMAPVTDPNLSNPWGLIHSKHGPWWISDNGSGMASIYTGAGQQAAPAISIPSPSGEANGGTPDGIVFNQNASQGWGNDQDNQDNQSFPITQNGKTGNSTFMFATEDGTILGWNKDVDPTSAVVAVDRSTVTDPQGDVGAVYKGLAIADDEKGDTHIYATNFRFGTVEMFDDNFNLVKSFTDPQLASDCPLPNQCFAPFGIQNINGDVYVTFALQDSAKHDDQAGPGNGFVDVFSPKGRLEQRLIAHGNLNSPWGLALAPHNFGAASGDLLVGNFGDGTINAYDPDTGEFDLTIKDAQGNPIQTDGLWGIGFGNNGQAGRKNELFFTAGINDEANGLFGKIVVNK